LCESDFGWNKAGDVRVRQGGKRILRAWLLTSLWLVVIALESTNMGSSDNTGHIFYPVFRLLFHLNPAQFEIWHHLLRKLGHFVGYFTLSVLFFRSWSVSFPSVSTRWCAQWATLAFFSTSLVASIDEWHQTSLPSRTGRLNDVLLDATAGAVAQFAIFLVWYAQDSTIQEATLARVKPNESLTGLSGVGNLEEHR
jgi:VanZ family protein